MKKKSPVTVFGTAVTLTAIAAAVLSSCKSVEEQLPDITDNSLPQAVTDSIDNTGNAGINGSNDTAANAFNDSEEPQNGYTYAVNPPDTSADGSPEDSLYEISVETARAADPDYFEDLYDVNADNISDDDPVVPAGGEPEERFDEDTKDGAGSADGENGLAGEITDISLTFYEISMNIGDTKMPIVTMYPEDAPDKSELWESSDSSVAEVDDIGNITAVSPGECVITVHSAVSPEVSARVKVYVKTPVSEPTYIGGILIANKSYPLPRDYNPGVDSEAQDAFDEMQEAAATEGLNIYISSGFRSYDYQAGLYERYVQRSGKAEADRYSARPGYSEHQSGLAFDLNSIDMTFADTPECEWVNKNCVRYGFIIRYPEDGEEKTGYMYEPWHIRYLGRETARKVYDSGLTLEEYLGIDSKYDE